MSTAVSRMPLIDAIKAVACLLIVAHHLSVYGPMSDYAYPLIGGVIDGLYEYGRMAVQAFLVIGGFLTARSLAPTGMSHNITEPMQLIGKRYFRLAIPYFAALTLAILAATVARAWMDHGSIPNAPEAGQLLAHAFFLQDLLNQEALSAGVWYVAIDFQLFTLTVALFWLAEKLGRIYLGPVFLAILTAASLFFFNRYSSLDVTALYFYGSYGLGALAYWLSARRDGKLWLLLLAVLVAGALMVDFRLRIALAAMVMLTLGLARHIGTLETMPVPQPLAKLGRISYSVFLVHFPVCLVVNAAFFHFFRGQPYVNLLGIFVAVACSLLMGMVFYHRVESRPLTQEIRLQVTAGLLAASFFAELGGAA